MPRRTWSLACALAAAFLAARALAAVDVVLTNGARVSAVLAGGADVHRFRVTCPAGAKLTVSAKAQKGGPDLTVRVVSPLGSVVASSGGDTKVALKTAAATSGTYSIEVSASDGTSAGAYTFSAKWKNPGAVKQAVTVAPDGRVAVVFSAQQGAVVTANLKPGKKSAAAPSLAAVVAPDGRTTALLGGASGGVPVGGTGDHLLVFGAGASGGLVNLSLKLKTPKPPKLELTIGADDVAPGAGVLAALTIGPEGGELAVDTGPLTGTSVTVDAGAVGAPTSFLVGDAPAVAGLKAGAAAGPAVFFGPEGVTFGGTVTVRIPFDALVFGGDTSKLRVYTRDADGNLSVVDGVTVEGDAGFVTFPVSHFSSYQVVREFAFQEKQRLTRVPPGGFVEFGLTVSISGDVAAAGQQGGGLGPSVAVFHRVSGDFVFEANLRPTGSPTGADFLGFSVSASGDRVLAGAPNKLFGALPIGAAYVFLRDPAGTWSQEAQLDSPTAGEDAFGSAVALEGDTAFVGAPQAGAGSRGLVFVFTRDTQTGLWSNQQTLSDPVARTEGRFGVAVALSGDTAIARWGQAGLGSAPDTLYVYRRAAGTWTLGARLTWPEIPRIVRDVKIDGTTIAVGGTDPAQTSYGEVRVLEDEGATFRQVARFTTADVLLPSDRPLDSLGFSVALRGDLLVAGAPDRSVLVGQFAYQTGNADVFQRIGGVWRYALRLRGRPDDAFPALGNQRLGYSVALDGTTAMVGAFQEDTDVSQGGAVYVVDLSGN